MLFSQAYNLVTLCVSLFLVTCVYSKGFYDFSAKDIKGNDVKFSKYKGKVKDIFTVVCSYRRLTLYMVYSNIIECKTVCIA